VIKAHASSLSDLGGAQALRTSTAQLDDIVCRIDDAIDQAGQRIEGVSLKEKARAVAGCAGQSKTASDTHPRWEARNEPADGAPGRWP
jgi:hypothetical protein